MVVVWNNGLRGVNASDRPWFDTVTPKTVLTATRLSLQAETANSTSLNDCYAYASFSYDIITLSLCVVCLLIGILYSFFGYRLFKIVLFLTGFLFGSVLIYLLCDKEELLSTMGNAGVGVGAGVLFGLITTLVEYVGLFMTGFLTGLLIGVVVMTVWASILPPSSLWATIGVLFCIGVVFAIFGLKFQRTMLMLSTSLIGGALIAVSLNYFVEKFLAVSRFWDALNVRAIFWTDLCWFSWLIIFIWPFIFVIGFLVQWKLTSVGFTHKASWPRLRRRQRTATTLVNNNIVASGVERRGGGRDHLRREFTDVSDLQQSNSTKAPKRVERRSFRHLYQTRRNQGDIICQSYIESIQKLSNDKTTPTMTSDQTRLTILTTASNQSGSSS